MIKSIDKLIYSINYLEKQNIDFNKEQLIDIVYKTNMEGVKFPLYNWTLAYNGIISEELLNDINLLYYLKLIKIEDSNKIRMIGSKNSEKILTDINNIILKDGLEKKINKSLKKSD